MVCPILHFKRINYRKDNFCQIRKTVNVLILSKFLYFFDSQNNVIAKSNFLKFCFTCSSQNLIKYEIFPSRNRKILSPQKFIPTTRWTVCYGTPLPPPTLPPSYLLHHLPLYILLEENCSTVSLFSIFLLWFFSSMHVILFE